MINRELIVEIAPHDYDGKPQMNAAIDFVLAKLQDCARKGGAHVIVAFFECLQHHETSALDFVRYAALEYAETKRPALKG